MIISISINGKGFSTFLHILRDEGTSRSVGLAKILRMITKKVKIIFNAKIIIVM